jgi:PIN domain nuclease of toxin-antitoxin system
MRILLDSHVLIWHLQDPKRLPRAARAAIEAEDGVVQVSAVSAWEIANKVRLGKWPEVAALAQAFSEVMQQYDFAPLAITLDHARLAGLLPGPHRDPFDRMLAAQSRFEGIPLVTADPAFRSFGIDVLW